MTLDAFMRKQRAEEDSKSPFKYLTITEQALRKAQAYARLVAETFDLAEYYGYLLGDAENNSPVVNDVLLAPDQKVTRGSCKVSPEGILKAGEEIAQLGKRCLGWVHSHPKFKPQHSHIDDRNHEVVLNQIGPANFVALEAAVINLESDLHTEFKDGVLIISGPNAVLELVGHGALEKTVFSKVKLKATEYISYAYSLVVTTSNYETYAEIMLKRWGSRSFDEETKSYQIDLNILHENADELQREIRERVTREHWSLGWGWRAWGDDEEEEEEDQGFFPRTGQKRSQESSWYSDW